MQEAEPQLVFAEASLRGLQRSENRGRDLAYVLKVMQTLRTAAEAARMGDIAHLAWVIECAVASCCPYADELGSEDNELLITANRLLRERVAALDDSHSRSLLGRLAQLTSRLFDRKGA